MKTSQPDDIKFMRMAIVLSKSNIVKCNGGPFGAVIVKNGKVIAKSANKVTSTNDPTAHAEISAIRLACKKLNTFDLSNCTIYTSCEPCPMCLGAIYWSRIEKIFFANSRHDAADAGFDDNFIYEELKLSADHRKMPSYQIMQNEAQEVFQAWKDSESKIPY